MVEAALSKRPSSAVHTQNSSPSTPDMPDALLEALTKDPRLPVININEILIVYPGIHGIQFGDYPLRVIREPTGWRALATLLGGQPRRPTTAEDLLRYAREIKGGLEPRTPHFLDHLRRGLTFDDGQTRTELLEGNLKPDLCINTPAIFIADKTDLPSRANPDTPWMEFNDVFPKRSGLIVARDPGVKIRRTELIEQAAQPATPAALTRRRGRHRFRKNQEARESRRKANETAVAEASPFARAFVEHLKRQADAEEAATQNGTVADGSAVSKDVTQPAIPTTTVILFSSNGDARPHIETVNTNAATPAGITPEPVSPRPVAPAALRAAAIDETPGLRHQALRSVATPAAREDTARQPVRPTRLTPHELQQPIDPSQNSLEHWLKLPRPVGAYMLGGNALKKVSALARLILDRARKAEGGYVSYQEMADSLLPADAPGHARSLLIRALSNATDTLQNRPVLTDLGLTITRSRRPELGNLPSFRLHGYKEAFAYKEASPAASRELSKPRARRKPAPLPVEIVLLPPKKIDDKSKHNLSVEVDGRMVTGLRASERIILLEALSRRADTTPIGIYNRLKEGGINMDYTTVTLGLKRLARNPSVQATEVGLYYRSPMVK